MFHFIFIIQLINRNIWRNILNWGQKKPAFKQIYVYFLTLTVSARVLGIFQALSVVFNVANNNILIYLLGTDAQRWLAVRK